MYHIHTTCGLVLDSKNYGEAGKILRVFTKDYGLIIVIAQGIRLEKSKLRYFIQNYVLTTISVVKGKEFWRLTNASSVPELDNADSVSQSKNNLLVVRICKILIRLLQGEEKHEELFNVIFDAIIFMHENEVLDQERSKTLESVIMFRILKLLGYIGKDDDIGEEISIGAINNTFLDASKDKRIMINKHVNKALAESHL